MQLSNEPLLSLAARRGHKGIAVALIEAGADVNARDDVRAIRQWLGYHSFPFESTVLAR